MRPPHLDGRLILLVALGGAVGTGVREALALTWPAPAHGFPLTIFVINVVGSFVLGALLETLLRGGADVGGRRILRVSLGTGVLGGFTTYSSYATDVALRLPHSTGLALGYGAVSLVVGCLAAFGGIAVASIVAARRPEASRPGSDGSAR